MLNYSMGTVARIGDLEYLATEVGRKGHALYGPYSPVQPGKWVVEFSLGWPLRIGAELYAGAAIEVTSEFGKSKIALDFVGLPELGAEPRTIPLAFDLSEERILEFRVYTIGHASLLIGDNPKLRPRGPEETSRCPGGGPELQGALPPVFAGRQAAHRSRARLNQYRPQRCRCIISSRRRFDR